MGGVNASNLMKSLSFLFYLEALTVSLATLQAAEIKDPTGFYKPFSDLSITKAPAKDQPPFPCLRSGHRLFQRPSSQKQIPNSQYIIGAQGVRQLHKHHRRQMAPDRVGAGLGIHPELPGGGIHEPQRNIFEKLPQHIDMMAWCPETERELFWLASRPQLNPLSQPRHPTSSPPAPSFISIPWDACVWKLMII